MCIVKEKYYELVYAFLTRGGLICLREGIKFGRA